jgi:hypothetical protein
MVFLTVRQRLYLKRNTKLNTFGIAEPAPTGSERTRVTDFITWLLVSSPSEAAPARPHPRWGVRLRPGRKYPA